MTEAGLNQILVGWIALDGVGTDIDDPDAIVQSQQA